MIFPLDQNKIISFTEYDSYDEDDESDVEMATHVQYVLDTSYILSDDLHESRTSVTTESEQSDNDEDEELERYRIIDPIFDSKAIRFLSCLLPLLRITKFMSRGSNVMVTRKCSKGHISQWRSQHKIKDGMSVGSLLLSSAILLTGNTYPRIKEFMEVGNIYFFSERTFVKLQTGVLFPSVNKVYKTTRNKIIGTLSNCSVNVFGDSHCDSSGFNAKYGTYTLMNTQTNLILDFHIVQTSTVGNSPQMEKEGLKHLMEKFRKKEISISSLTADRHVQKRSYMKRKHPQKKHQFDV